MHITSIAYRLQQLKLVVKKIFRYSQCILENTDKSRRYLERWYFFRQERKIFVYVDESGFATTAELTHDYAPRVEKVYEPCSGHRRPLASQIAAHISREPAAPTASAEALAKAGCCLREHVIPSSSTSGLHKNSAQSCMKRWRSSWTMLHSINQ